MIRSLYTYLLLALVLSPIVVSAQDDELLVGLESDVVETHARGCPASPPIEVSMPLLDENDQALVIEALNLDGAQRFPVCAYRAVSSSNDRSDWVEQFIPTNNPPSEIEDEDQIGWELVSVEGRPPTEKELSEYEHRGGMLYPYLDLYEVVDFANLQVAERQPDKVIFETRPTFEFLDKNDAGMLDDHVTTTLVIDASTRRIDFVTTRLDKEFKPNAFIKVYRFDQSLDYAFVPEVGEVILTELRMQADVRFVVIRRQFHLNADLSDFSCPVALQPATCNDPALSIAD